MNQSCHRFLLRPLRVGSVRRLLQLGVILLTPVGAYAAGTTVAVQDGKILLNGEATKLIGLRCSNALVSNDSTDGLIDALDIYRSYGVNCISVFIMGSRFGDVKGYLPDSSLNPRYESRLQRLLRATDDRGMVTIVGCLYWGGSKAKEELAAWTQVDANKAIQSTAVWLKQNGFRHVILDPDNEGMAVSAMNWSAQSLIQAAKDANGELVVANNTRQQPTNEDLNMHFGKPETGKPWLDSEATPRNAPGNYWGAFSKETHQGNQDFYNYSRIGRYTREMKSDQLERTRLDLERFDGYVLASTWLQCGPKSPVRGPFTRIGGHSKLGSERDTSADWNSDIDTIHPDAGIRWWLEFVREEYGSSRQASLWSSSMNVPAAEELPDLPGTSFHVIKRREPQIDGFTWLHGVALAFHDGRLFATFGHNKGAENTATEVANTCVSGDNGATWGDLRPIDERSEEGLAVSHGVLVEHQGKLWAFHGAFNGMLQRVHTRAYVFDDANKTWDPKGKVVGDGFWPMDTPRRMSDGNWIVSGVRIKNGNGGANDPAAVAISHGDDLTRWDLVVVPKSDENDMWGESTVLIDGPNILNIARYRRPVALVANSSDHGRSWSLSRRSNLPMAASKPFAGELSNGIRYLIGTTTANSGNRRSPLTIAIARPQQAFSRIFRIRAAVHAGPGESNPRVALAYPYAVENHGKLYVAYSNDGGRGQNQNSAELAVIPISSLTW